MKLRLLSACICIFLPLFNQAMDRPQPIQMTNPAPISSSNYKNMWNKANNQFDKGLIHYCGPCFNFCTPLAKDLNHFLIYDEEITLSQTCGSCSMCCCLYGAVLGLSKSIVIPVAAATALTAYLAHRIEEKQASRD